MSNEKPEGSRLEAEAADATFSEAPVAKNAALDSIKAAMPGLAEAEKRIAAFVLASPQKVLHLNINELARQAQTSPAAVVRFCRSLGAGKYGDFKLWLARDVYRGWDERSLPDLDLEAQTPGTRAIHDTIASVRRTMTSLAQTLNPEVIEEAAARIKDARLTALFGIGASGLVAQDFHQKLARIGIPSFHFVDVHAQITASCALRPTSLAFIISYSGETREMLEVAKQVRTQGCYSIAMTTAQNSLGGLVDLVLEIPTVERTYRSAAELSRISQLAVIDVLFNVIVSKDIDGVIAALDRSMEATHHQT